MCSELFFQPSVCLCTGLVPCPFQGGPRHPPALVLHHHIQRGQTLHEEQAAGEGTDGRQSTRSVFFQFASPLNTVHNSPQVFVHGDELNNYFKDFDADILPADFDGKASVADCQAIATKLFGSEDTAL